LVLGEGAGADGCGWTPARAGVAKAAFPDGDAVRVGRAGLVVVRSLDDLRIGVVARQRLGGLSLYANVIDTAVDRRPEYHMSGAVLRTFARVRRGRLTRFGVGGGGVGGDRPHVARVVAHTELSGFPARGRIGALSAEPARPAVLPLDGGRGPPATPRPQDDYARESMPDERAHPSTLAWARLSVNPGRLVRPAAAPSDGAMNVIVR